MKFIAQMIEKAREIIHHHHHGHDHDHHDHVPDGNVKSNGVHVNGANATTKTWRILSGENHWEGLLDPLDVDVRRLVIHYGDMVQATYDTFITQKVSRFAGASRYSEKDLFAKVGLEKGNPVKYSVTRFIYATSKVNIPEALFIKSLSREAWSRESNWMGYISVATDEGAALLGRRDIVVTWRGTIQAMEWLDDFEFALVSAPEVLGKHHHHGAKIHQGFYSIYTSSDPRSQYCKKSARDQASSKISRLVEKYKDEKISITVTGHSLGASLATLTAFDIAANGFNKGCLVTAIVLACPRVGDFNFKKLFSATENLRALRVRNIGDIVPEYPMLGYSDVGEEIVVDSSKSNYLKDAGLDLSKKHSLQVYLHMMAGKEGPGGAFELVVDRDIALVNRSIDALKEEYLVPAAWWVALNKGMVQQDDGSWKLMDHEVDVIIGK
ncbi:hypothetical protein MLD38_016729 [Melastoma candidum]|uniref:Uncharacterized protein n=1 Tax=Melastoma candidum TaxID=119954 RepID=A0ACB9QRG5_9MYRT|nr:hypothetical protein MLD38_016729 [Melastoma candidum]